MFRSRPFMEGGGDHDRERGRGEQRAAHALAARG